MKFLVSNYSCFQNPWLGGYRPPPPTPLLSVLFPPLNLLNPPKQNSWVRHCCVEIIVQLQIVWFYMTINCTLIWSRCNCTCILALMALKMAAWVTEACLWLLCNKTTFINPNAFVGSLKNLHQYCFRSWFINWWNFSARMKYSFN